MTLPPVPSMEPYLVLRQLACKRRKYGHLSVQNPLHPGSLDAGSRGASRDESQLSKDREPGITLPLGPEEWRACLARRAQGTKKHSIVFTATQETSQGTRIIRLEESRMVVPKHADSAGSARRQDRRPAHDGLGHRSGASLCERGFHERVRTGEDSKHF